MNSVISNLLRAGQIVGLDPREMIALALEQLAEENQRESAAPIELVPDPSLVVRRVT